LIAGWWMLANRRAPADQQRVAASGEPVTPTGLVTPAMQAAPTMQAKVEPLVDALRAEVAPQTETLPAGAWTSTAPAEAVALESLPESPKLTAIDSLATIDEFAWPAWPAPDETPA